jgi:LmbE family N-acetylglucosaminyl deacetylase
MAYHPDHPKAVHIVKRLGHALQQQSRYKEAQMMYERVLRIKSPSCRFIHPATTGTKTFLANVLLKQQQYIETNTT